MKRCPECARDYNDDSLSFCLDDGAELLFGPASDEPATAVLNASYEHEKVTEIFESAPAEERSTITKTNRNLLVAVVFGLVLFTSLGIGGYLYFGRISAKKIESIAVMPLLNENGNIEVDYIADGLTETLIAGLSRLPGLDVKPRSSVFRFKGKQTDSQTVARDLGVQAVLSGRVTQRGQAVSLFVELIDASLDKVIWSQQYNSNMADLSKLQAEIARDVASNLRQRLTEADNRNIMRRYTENAEAYALYLKGRFYWDKRNEDGYEVAIEAYDRAIELDPDYALAYVGLADCYLFRAATMPRQEAMPRAKEYALKALELDNSLAEAHTTLAFIKTNYDLDMAGAETQFKRAIELDPSYAVAHQFYGTMLIVTGRPDEGLAEMRKAVDLEPFSVAINWSLGLGLTYARKYDEAVEQQERTLGLQPGYALAEGNLIGLFILQEEYEHAFSLIQKQLQSNQKNEGALTSLAIIYARTGRQAEARKTLSVLEKETSEPKGNRSYGIAKIYAALGEKDNAIRMLVKAMEERAFSIMFLRVDPYLDRVRDDPDFQKLLARSDPGKKAL